MHGSHQTTDRRSASRSPGYAAAVFLCCLILAVCLPACQLIPQDMNPGLSLPTGEPESPDPDPTDAVPVVIDSPLHVTEVMTANRTTLPSLDGSYPDWIELHNASSQPIDLKGYRLSDRLNNPERWIFPDIRLEAGDYLIVFASGLPQAEAAARLADGEVHASFRLSSSGEPLLLTDPAGQVLFYQEIPALPDDQSFGRRDQDTAASDPGLYLPQPSPGRANGTDGYRSLSEIPVPRYDLLINEYVSRSLGPPDSDGDDSDWVEIFNHGDTAVPLGGFALSDRPENPQRWVFPELIIEPDTMIVIWLSGKIKSIDPDDPSTWHASFALGSEDRELLLSDPSGHPVDRVTLTSLPVGVSHGRDPDQPDQWFFYPRPTPGQPNRTAGFSDLNAATSLNARPLRINEVRQLSSRRVQGQTERDPDWIELFNAGSEPVALDGYGLSDRRDEPYRHDLSGEIIQPGEYLLIEPDRFGLSASGETLWLTAPDGQVIDWLSVGQAENNLSIGRPFADEQAPADETRYYLSATPGQPNDSPSLSGRAAEPLIQAMTAADGQPHDNLYADQPLLVQLTADQPDSRIHYTLDGTLPDESAPRYREPLRITGNTILRAIVLRDDHLPSRTVSRTWLYEQPHDLPVMSLTLPDTDLTDPTDGMFTSFMAKTEVAADYQFYETDGRLGIDFTAGLSLHGSYSRREEQKSLQISLRPIYGQSDLTYPLFAGNPVTTFRRLVLRTSGQDWKSTKLRDAFMTRVVQNEMALDTMDVRACVVYINGRYHGLYELREKVNSDYMASHHGIDPDRADVIKGNRIVLSGSMAEWDALIRYIRLHDLREAEPYHYVLSQIDEHSLMDFLIAQSFFSNPDSGNKKFWRERSEDGQWRWVFFDLDWGLRPETYDLNWLRGDLLHPEGHGHARIFSTEIQVRLMENEDFRQRFAERYAWMLNHVLTTERMLPLFDQMTETIRSEMPRQIARWGEPASVEEWEQNIAEMRAIIEVKHDQMIEVVRETFELDDASFRELFGEDTA